jgi:hypothetical protein
MSDIEREFRSLLAEPEETALAVPSSLKARLYSMLVHTQQESGPLASLDECVAAGHGICVFEKLVQISPLGKKAKSPFFCEVCHARVLAEHFDHPPIFWDHCPYVKFQRS